ALVAASLPVGAFKAWGIFSLFYIPLAAMGIAAFPSLEIYAGGILTAWIAAAIYVIGAAGAIIYGLGAGDDEI
ncbi:hypothetical protein L0Y49_02325, partial [bacterium]|nr:hypothetical protein [bacterium]